MRILIDTHTFLWFVRNDSSLSTSARIAIEDPNVEVLISVASIWEMSIKTAINKLTISGGFAQVQADLTLNSIEIFPINFDHTLRYNQLPFHHRDPFDRMLAAQALVEQIDLVSADAVFDSYFQGSGVKRIW